MHESRNDLHATIGRIYDTIDDSSVWNDVLERIRTKVGSVAVVLACQAGDADSEIEVFCSGRLNARIAADPRAYLRSEPLLSTMARAPYRDRSTVSSEQVTVGRDPGSSSRYRSHWLESEGITRADAIPLCGGNNVTAALLVYMATRELDWADKSFIESLRPHLQRGISLGHRMKFHDTRERWHLCLLDRLKFGLVLMDGQASPVFVNRTMTTILARHPSIKVTKTGVQFKNNPQACRKLRRSVQRMSNQACLGRTPKVVNIRLCPDIGGPFISVVVISLSKHSQSEQTDTVRLAMLVNDPACCDYIDSRYLESHYALTSAEARIAVSLAGGDSAKQIAMRRGVALSTIRAQIRSVMRKLDVRRQTDVIRLLISDCMVQVEQSS